MSEASKYVVRRFVPADTESFYAAVRESIDELAYWMPWCSKDYAFSDAENWITATIDLW